jgi:hypothetical protein
MEFNSKTPKANAMLNFYRTTSIYFSGYFGLLK